MARLYSHKAFPHRVLFDTGENAQRGDDVKVLRRHVQRRLEARDIARRVGRNDGVFRDPLHDAAKTAAHFLGVPQEWTDADGLLVREQRVIIYPQTRTHEMLDAAGGRMDKLLKQRAEKEKTRGDGKLTDAERSEARRLAVRAFALLRSNHNIVHYTQGASRWQGINERRRANEGRFPHYADCSSAATWAWWNALTHVDGPKTPDRINGSNWTAGYTGTMLSHGWKVTDRRPGDLVLYGRGFPGGHVAMVATDTNMVYSHGSESGPYYLPWNYRSDVIGVRRYI